MDLRLLTWNGTNINNGSPFTSYFPRGSKVSYSANAVSVPRAGNYPYLSAVVPNASTLMIGVNIAAGQSINTNREIFKQTFNFEDGARHNLIAEDGSGGTQWYLTGFVRQVQNEGDSENSFFVIFAVEYPYWRLVTATDTTWNVTATLQTNAFTNAGNINVPPVITLKPTVTKTGGLSYRRWVPIYNNLDVSFDKPLDITSGGIDTATLTPSKMQTSGNDFRVTIDGVEVDRWLSGMDTSNTKCWCNVSLAPRSEGTISATVANTTGASTVTFAKSRANLAFLSHLRQAENNVMLCGSEALIYDPDNVNLVTYQIASVTRAAKGTSAATHAGGSTIRHIEHDTWILYGDSTLSAPDVDDDNKPLFALTSTNAAWSWTNFYSASTPARPGGWTGEVLASRTGLSYVFTGNENAFADPSTELGMALVGSADFQVQNESGTLAWNFSHPATVKSVVYSGEKYCASTSSWPAIVGLQHLQANAVWFTDELQTVPAVPSAWGVFGPSTAAMPTPYPETIRFVIDGLLSSVVNDMALAQFDTVTANFSTSALPTISVGSEAACNYFDVTITNVTTGEYIQVAAPCKVNETLTIDCLNKEAYLSDGSRVSVTLSTDRAAWLDLRPGANTLRYADAGTNAVTVHCIHRDRAL